MAISKLQPMSTWLNVKRNCKPSVNLDSTRPSALPGNDDRFGTVLAHDKSLKTCSPASTT